MKGHYRGTGMIRALVSRSALIPTIGVPFVGPNNLDPAILKQILDQFSAIRVNQRAGINHTRMYVQPLVPEWHDVLPDLSGVSLGVRSDTVIAHFVSVRSFRFDHGYRTVQFLDHDVDATFLPGASSKSTTHSYARRSDGMNSRSFFSISSNSRPRLTFVRKESEESVVIVIANFLACRANRSPDAYSPQRRRQPIRELRSLPAPHVAGRELGVERVGGFGEAFEADHRPEQGRVER